MVLKQIASDNNIHLPMEEEEEEDLGASTGEPNESIDGSSRRRRRTKYKDVADAAQAAFESAAYAAAAARAAVELSRSESADSKPRVNYDDDDDEHIETEMKFDKIKPLHQYDTELKKTFSSSSSDSSDDYVKEADSAKIKQGNVTFDESESDDVEGSNRGDQLMEEEEETQGVEPLNINRRPISVRGRWAQRR